jgi:hypothetical protein
LGGANRLSEGRISAPETNSGAKSNPEIKAEASLSFMVHVSRKIQAGIPIARIIIRHK